MFFGKIITQAQPYSFTESEVDESSGEVLSLTNAALAPNSKESASLFVKNSEGEFLIAVLTKDKPHATINVFLSLMDEVKLIVKGNGNIHVVGFFEPSQDDEFMNPADLEGEEESDEEEEEDAEEL
jgi:hypothetical protein